MTGSAIVAENLEKMTDIDRLALLQQNMVGNEKYSKLESAQGAKELFDAINNPRRMMPAFSYPAMLEDVRTLNSAVGLPSRTQDFLDAYKIDVLEQGFLERGLLDSLKPGQYEVAFILKPEAGINYHTLDADFLQEEVFECLSPVVQRKIRGQVSAISLQPNKRLLMKMGRCINTNLKKDEVLGTVVREDILYTSKFRDMAHKEYFASMPLVSNTGRMVLVIPGRGLIY